MAATQSMLNPTHVCTRNHQIGCYFWTRNEEMFHFTQVLLALLPIFIIADVPPSAVAAAAAHTNLGLGEIEVEVYFMPTWQSRREASWWRRQWRCRWCVTIFFAKRRIAHTSSSPRREVAQPKPNISNFRAEQTTQQFFLAHMMMRWTLCGR